MRVWWKLDMMYMFLVQGEGNLTVDDRLVNAMVADGLGLRIRMNLIHERSMDKLVFHFNIVLNLALTTWLVRQNLPQLRSFRHLLVFSLDRDYGSHFPHL